MSTLVAAYTFNDNTGQVYDYSGNKVTLTPSSGAMTLALTTSPVGVGYDCTMNKACTGASFGAMGAYAGLTVFAYFKFNGVVGSTQTFITNTNSFSVAINSSGNVVFTTIDGSSVSYALTSTTVLTSGNWYTVTCTWNSGGGGSMYIFINGVQDSSVYPGAAASLNNTAGALVMGVLGTGPNYSLMNTLEVRNAPFILSQVQQLEASPGGIMLTTDGCNFAVGDFIMDDVQQGQAFVTWVTDPQHFYIYPVNGNAVGSFSRYGNIYATARQYAGSIINDFDGNTNAQLATVFPIVNAADYASPANAQKLDYTGLTLPNTAFIKGQTGLSRIDMNYGGVDATIFIATKAGFIQPNAPYILLDNPNGAAGFGADNLNNIGFTTDSMGGGVTVNLGSSGATMAMAFSTKAIFLDGSLMASNYTAKFPNKSGTQTFAMLSDLTGFGSGTVTSITAGTGLTGGTITTSGTIALASALPNGQTATTQASGDNSTKIATTAFAQSVYNDPTLAAYQVLGSTIKAQTIGLSIVNITATTNLVSGQLLLIPVNLTTAQTLTGVCFFQTVKGSYTGHGYVGLYTYSAGSYTQVAVSNDNANLFQTSASNTFVKQAFSGTYAAAAGMYWIGIIWTQSAVSVTPAMGYQAALQNAAIAALDFTNSSVLYGSVAGQTSLVTPIAASSVVAGNTRWAAIY